MQTELEILKLKLKGFIRKFYKNQIIKGFLIGSALMLFFFLSADLIEYFFWADTHTRTAIFYLFIALSAFVVIKFMLIPIVKLFQLAKTLTNKEAAKIIGDHFPEVGDKLLNTLQLEDYINEKQISDIDLLLASVKQKAADLTPIPFKNAIEFKQNLKYVKYLVPFVVIILLSLPKRFFSFVS